MPHYVDASAQTLIEGLARDPTVHPSALLPPTDTTTPPDDMAIDKLQIDSTPTISKTNMDSPTSPTLLLRRKKRPSLVARISMPKSIFDKVKFDDEDPASPPPTEAVLSPLPAANRLHAGHTPIIPGARSPLPQEESGPPTPVEDEALRGPLFLPPQPGDGAEDTIPLTALDAELERVRLEQEKEEGEQSVSPPPAPTDDPNLDPEPSQPLSAVEPSNIPPSDDSTQLERNISNESRGSSDSSDKTGRSTDYSIATRRSSADDAEVFDGVILKKPKMNLGAPLGQA